MVWSTSPDRTWQFTNRTLVYAAFALLGVLVGARTPRARIAEGAAALLGLLVGWALLAKCVPALYGDYGRLARLRSPLDYWNELALLCTAGVPLALWLAARRRIEGVVLLYGLTVTLLLTYSRFGVALACLAAAAWVVLDRKRVESLAAVALGGGIGAAVFGVALALPGITSDGEPRSVRAHDGWIFALVVLAGAALVAGARMAAAPARGVARPARPHRARRGSRRARARGCRARGQHRLRGPHLERVHEPVEHAGAELEQPARLGEEQPLGLVGGGVARVHAPSGRRHRRGHVRAHEPDAAQDARRRRRAAQHAAPVPERDGDRRLPALPRHRGRRALGRVARAARPRRARARDRRRRLLRARDRRQGLELRRVLRAALPRRGRARRAARGGACAAADAPRGGGGRRRARRGVLARCAVARRPRSSRRRRRRPT